MLANLLLITYNLGVIAGICFLGYTSHPWLALMLFLAIGGRTKHSETK